MTTSNKRNIQSRGYRVDDRGKVTRRFRNMDTGEWFTRTITANSAAAKAAVKRANARVSA
jgi:hypothetical protein